MSNENLKRQIERIQKLMTLAMADPDSPEATAASKKAAELLAKYELDMADLTEENKHDILNETFKNYSKHHLAWEKYLLGGLVSAFDVHPVITYEDIKRTQVSYKIFGKKQDLVMAAFIFKVVRRAVIKRGEKLYKYLKERTAFQNGFVYAVGHRLNEIKEEREKHRTEMTSALAVQNKADVDAFVRETHGKLKATTPKVKAPQTHEESQAFYTGVQEGENISLSTPIE